MASRTQTARKVQKLTGWSYTKALWWVRENSATARDFAAEQKVTYNEVVERMVQAELEVEKGAT